MSKYVTNLKRAGVVAGGTILGGLGGYLVGGLVAKLAGLPVGGLSAMALGVGISTFAPGKGGNADLFALSTGAGTLSAGLVMLSAGLGLYSMQKAAAVGSAPVAGLLAGRSLAGINPLMFRQGNGVPALMGYSACAGCSPRLAA